MKPYGRAERISVKIQQSVTELIQKKMKDPRLELATISAVKLTADLRIATVYVSIFGEGRKKKEAMDAFKKSKGYIKKMIAPKLGLKFMPELFFEEDDFFDKAMAMDKLIRDANAVRGDDYVDPDAPSEEESSDDPQD
ncbi:MAG: 30S ribosome-binding factor RbfA [Desulfobacterales bacterium]|nr:30S ribosome-binding factor RbfA [Desulfobacterales bacterium]